MFGPVLRLLATYLVVGLAVFAFIKRDTVMGLFGHDRPTAAQSAESAPATTPSAPATPAAPAEASTDRASTAPAPQPNAAPAPKAALQTLQAPAQAAPAVPAATTAAPAAAPTPTAPDGARLYEARRTYWDKDPNEAIAIYIELLKADPENMELNGELGNIYYMRGEYPKAAKYYRRAGEAALKAGNRPQVLQLVSILRSLDPEASKALEAGLEGRK